ncbi:MAG: hypothetical protein FE835_08035 [Gammaproteobacteria bacterium]|nr:hypothetical protein [Gammaproteobacteria bacterium]
MPSLITTVISFCRSRPASGSLRQSIASSDQTSYPYLKWLNGVSDAYAYCGLPAFVSLSMAGSERDAGSAALDPAYICQLV